MVTYGDSITLLLTFFVLLLTFSTPNEEDYQQFARGLLSGGRTMGLMSHRGNSMVSEEQLLAASRLTEDGAEKPPENDESPLESLQTYDETIDISQLRELHGAYVIRVPITELFGVGDRLEPNGRQILDHVVKMTRARRYSIVVRAKAVTGATGEERLAHSVALALKMVRYLRDHAGAACRDIGVSNDDCELSQPSLREGECEIIMLEV